MSNKRSEDVKMISISDPLYIGPSSNGLIDGLQQLGRDEVAAVLATSCANVASISTAVFKRTRIELPSFSVAKWSEFAKNSGLPQNVSRLKLEPFATPYIASRHRCM